MKRQALRLILVSLGLSLTVLVWQWLDPSSLVVELFGKPSDAANYLQGKGRALLDAAIDAVFAAVVCLLIAGVVAALALAFGLLDKRFLAVLDRLGAVTQTLPIQASVLVVYVVLSSVCKRTEGCFYLTVFNLTLIPTSIALFFPPFIYGAKGVESLPFELKALLRSWNAPRRWRIRMVYLPQALPHLLAGLRVSSAWAVPAVIVCQGLVSSADGGSTSLAAFMIHAFRSQPHGEVVSVVLVATISGWMVYWLFRALEGLVKWRLYGEAFRSHEEYHWL